MEVLTPPRHMTFLKPIVEQAQYTTILPSSFEVDLLPRNLCREAKNLIFGTV